MLAVEGTDTEEVAKLIMAATESVITMDRNADVMAAQRKYPRSSAVAQWSMAFRLRVPALCYTTFAQGGLIDDDRNFALRSASGPARP